MTFRLFTDLVEDSLSEVAYFASLAGLHYDVSTEKEGMYVSVRGYNEKLPALLGTVIDRLKTVNIREDRLKVFVEKVSTFVCTVYDLGTDNKSVGKVV